jgi:hypothetical protein
VDATRDRQETRDTSEYRDTRAGQHDTSSRTHPPGTTVIRILENTLWM